MKYIERRTHYSPSLLREDCSYYSCIEVERCGVVSFFREIHCRKGVANSLPGDGQGRQSRISTFYKGRNRTKGATSGDRRSLRNDPHLNKALRIFYSSCAL